MRPGRWLVVFTLVLVVGVLAPLPPSPASETDPGVLSEDFEVVKAAPGDRLGSVPPGETVRARLIMDPAFPLPRALPGLEIVGVGSGSIEVVGEIDRVRGSLGSNGVVAVERIYDPIELTVTEGLAPMLIDAVHAEGHDGAGARVAIIDIGFVGYDALLGSELPSSVVARSFRSDGDIYAGTVHGTAVAEIVHDVAPAAELYLINFDGENLGPVVDYLIAQKIDVVNTSIGWTVGPFDGTSPVSLQVRRAVNRGITWVTSAGNSAETHWGGTFTDADSDGWHDFDTGAIEVDWFWIAPRSWFRVDQTWANDQADYDLCLFDWFYGALRDLVCSSAFQSPGDRPIESILWFNSSYSWYRFGFASRLWSGRSTHLDVFINGPVDDIQYSTSSHSILVPGDAAAAITVGAVPWISTTIASYSSRGPTADGRIKPDFVAPTRVSTATYGPRDFGGTSSSSPHVAGLAALYVAADPSWGPAYIRDALTTEALPLGTRGKDNTYGWGLARAGDLPRSPRFDLGANTSVGLGDPFAHTLAIDDPDSVGWTASIDYGEAGQSPVVVSLSEPVLELRHHYETEDVFRVTVEVTDAEGYSGKDWMRVTVGPPLCEGQTPTHLGTPGSDTMLGSPGDDVIILLGGDDIVHARGGDDLICAGEGNDVVYGEIGDDVIYGGDGRDRLSGGSGVDWVSGGEGNDVIRLGARDDTGYGDAGNDVINGGGGVDHIDGGDDNDVIWDSFGADVDLYGGPGNDKFVVGRGEANTYTGGHGSDRVDYRAMTDGVNVSLTRGTGIRAVVDTYVGIEQLRGSSFDDVIVGDGGANVLIGSSGDDEIYGRGGDDTLVGDNGDDLLDGGSGANDRLIGGPGTADRCINGSYIDRSCELFV